MENQNTNMENQSNNNDVISTGNWFVTLLITAIPLIGIIMLFVWGFSDGTNPNKRNWARAALIWVAIVIVINIFMFFGMLGMAGSMNGGY